MVCVAITERGEKTGELNAASHCVRNSEREKEAESRGERHCGSMSVCSRYAVVCFDIYLYGCVSVREQQVILLLQASENRVSRRHDCGRREREPGQDFWISCYVTFSHREESSS